MYYGLNLNVYALGKHRPSLEWVPYKRIVTDGVCDDESLPTLESIVGQEHAVIADRHVRSSAFHAIQEVPVQNGEVYGTVPKQVFQQMMNQIKFRKHPKNLQKWAYTLTTVGKKGALGKAADSKEEVCQLIWDEFRQDWSNCVSMTKR
jgi:hypothetical protein